MRIKTLSWIELKLSFRSMDMVLFGFLMPLAIIIIIGLIYADHAESGGMIERNIGAYVAIGICAVGLMGMPLTLADYRHRKVLKRLQVTPASPALLLGIQVLVQGMVAVCSGILVIAAAALIFGYRPSGTAGQILAAYLLVLFSIFSIGMCIAAVAPDIKKAGLLCSVLYFPMLLFSGTTIPFEVFPGAVQRAAGLLPLSQGIQLLNEVSMGGNITDKLPRVFFLLGLALLCVVVSIKTFRWDMN